MRLRRGVGGRLAPRRYLAALAVLVAVVALPSLVGGCAFLGLAKQRGAQFYDRALAESEWFICNAASIGSVKRRYGTDAERARTYNGLCSQAGAGLIIVAPEVPVRETVPPPQ